MESTVRSLMRSTWAALALAAMVPSAFAQTNPTAQPLPYAENFSTLAHTATAYPAGWQGWTISTTPGSAFNTAGPTADRTLTASSSASTSTGNVHNYNGKIGFLNSGSLDLALCLALNTTGNANVQVAYDIMTIRNPYDGTTNTRINEVTLQYRTGTTGAWTSLTGIEYQNNTTLQTGAGVTTPQNLQARTITLPIACDNQPVVQLRWASRQVSGGGSRPSFAVDNLNVTGSPLTNTTVAFTTAASTVSEGVGTTSLTVAINNPSSTQATTVNVAITAGSAARVNNYTTQTVTFPAGSSANQDVTITVTDDAVYDGGGLVAFTLQNISGGQGTPAIGGPSSHVLTITENEPSPLIINEVDYDNPTASDTLEFVEIKNTGPTAIDLAGFKIELVNGNAGGAVVYTTITLPSFSLAPGAYYVVGNDASIPNINLVTGASTNFIQNGAPDAIGLRDPSNTLIDAVSYEGNSGAPYTEGTGIAIIDSDDATDGIGISRFPDGTDTGNNSADWSRRCLSPGASNNSTNTNCICTPPDVSVNTECIDDNTWRIVVVVNNTGSGTTVDITNNFNSDQVLGVGPGTYFIAGGGFPNNAVVNLSVAHQTFDQCDLLFGGLTNNCFPDCNSVPGGSALPGSPCDDLDPQTINDVWSPTCVCAGVAIQPVVGFVLPTATVGEDGVALTVGVEMDIAPTTPVLIDVIDLLTGTATSGADYTALGTVQLTFLPTDTYPYLQTFNVLLNNDTDYEPTETLNLSLSVNTGTALIGTGSFTAFITSEDLPALRINEVDYDNAGTDNAEWIELKNTGNSAIDVGGFSVLLVNGNLGGAAVYKTILLPSFSLAAGGYYVIGNNASIPNLNLLQTPATDMIQNGAPDAIGLRAPDNTLIDAISYEGSTGAPYTEGTGLPAAQFDDNVLAAKVIARYLDGNDTDNNSVDWKVWCATPGASNATVDGDADLVPDCLDNCPALAGVQGGACNDNDACTINDVITNACVCAGTFQDTDGDGICNANDNCPALAGVQGDACNDNDACTTNDVISSACVCAGTFQDTDGDGICNANDNCPTLAGVQGDACNDNDACTINDVITNACVCSGTFQDTDGDGICNANDNCPALAGVQGDACNDNDACTINDVISSACVCAGTFQDTDGDGICNANDNCPALAGVQGDACNDNDACTINDVITNACVCAGTFQDTDGDGICNANDNCPTTPGVIGSACNDGNPFTTADVLQNDCSCSGTPVPCDNWTLTFNTDLNGSQTTWQIVDATSPFVLASGGGNYGNNTTVIETVCVPQFACFRLTVNDAGGNGITGGGWKLTDNFGRIIVDNTGNGGAFTSSCTTGDPWCNEPSSTQTLLATQCGRLNWLANDVIIASANAAVSAQWGIGDQTDDGYQFWFENPLGGYTRRIFRNHATSGGHGPANAVRACKLALATIVTNPLPANTLLNVRIRARVNGVNGAWGPACQFKIDPNSCTLTKLNDIVTSPNYSCGVTGKLVGASGNTGRLFAKVVTSGGVPAAAYRFELVQPAAGYTRVFTQASATLVLGNWSTNPLLCGTWVYNVRVAASFDGGVTFCPYGDVCTVGISNNNELPLCTQTIGITDGGGEGMVAETTAPALLLYPNPNRGEQLFVNLTDISADVNVVTVDLYDMFGKRVMTATLPVQDGLLQNNTLELGADLAAGLYLVNVTAGDFTTTERLVIQR